VNDPRAEARRLQELDEWSEEALAANDAILLIEPEDEAAGVRRARCLRALGRLDESLETLESILRRKPASMVARSQAEKTRRWLAARRRAEDLLAETPSRLIEAVERAKEDERDIQFQIEARRLLARREPTIEAACALAAAQRRGGDLEGALNTYGWAREQDDSPRTNPMAHVGLAAVLRERGRRNDAEKILRAVLAVRPRDRFAEVGLAAVLMDRAEKRGAEDHLAEAKRLLDAAWAAGDPDAALRAAYGRLKAISRRLG
jgi:tetratricopeptide (TPR) repeat protein